MPNVMLNPRKTVSYIFNLHIAFIKTIIVLFLLISSPIGSANSEVNGTNSDSAFLPKNLEISKNIKIIPLRFEGKRSELGSVCSMTLLSKDFMIFCNYQQLILVNLRTGKLKLLKPPASITTWRPTGVKYVKEQNILYVANYKGKDAFSFHVDSNFNLQLLHRYVSQNIVGPENIDASTDGKMMVIADYDANKIIFYKNNVEQWAYPIPGAHGISFTEDYKAILATGLAPAKIYKLNLHGKLENQWGSDHFGKDGYLWPTSIAVLKGDIAVSDAHTGKITFINSKLQSEYCIAGNGLGLDLLNMPYGLVFAENGDLYIVDTFKMRILKVNPRTEEILVAYEFPINKSLKKQFKKNQQKKMILNREPLGILYNNRMNQRMNTKESFNIKLDPITSYTWHAAYNGFAMEGRLLNLNGMGDLFVSGEYYWTFARAFNYSGEEYFILGSPQRGLWVVLYDSILFPIALGKDFWLENEKMISSRGEEIPFLEIAKQVSMLSKQYHDKIKEGVNPLQAMAVLYGEENLEARLKASFQSEQGKKLYLMISNTEDILIMQKAAKLYLQEIKNLTYLNLVEIVIANSILKSQVYKAQSAINPKYIGIDHRLNN